MMLRSLGTTLDAAHKQVSEAKMEAYMAEFFPRTRAKFDLNNAGLDMRRLGRCRRQWHQTSNLWLFYFGQGCCTRLLQGLPHQTAARAAAPDSGKGCRTRLRQRPSIIGGYYIMLIGCYIPIPGIPPIIGCCICIIGC